MPSERERARERKREREREREKERGIECKLFHFMSRHSERKGKGRKHASAQAITSAANIVPGVEGDLVADDVIDFPTRQSSYVSVFQVLL